MSKHLDGRRSRKHLSSAQRMLGTWAQGRSAFPGIRIRPERILIVTEGTKTEPNYFNGFRTRINESFGKQYITVKIVGLGENTVSLFKRAKSLCEKDADGYTQVWLVYDKDSFPARDFNAVADLCKGASVSSTAYHAAWTNESFELWFLLHFCFIESALDRELCSSKLTDHLSSSGCGKYEKSRNDMFEILEHRMKFAISNAERLEKKNFGKTPSDSNPGTTVHLLIKELLPYL